MRLSAVALTDTDGRVLTPRLVDIVKPSMRRLRAFAMTTIMILGFCTVASAGVSAVGCKNDQPCIDGASCEIDALTFRGSSNSIRLGHCVLRNPNGISAFFDQGGGTRSDGPHPEGPWDRLMRIEFTGLISHDKVSYLRRMMATHRPIEGYLSGKRPDKFAVSLDSPGGDVYAAMELGRVFRRNLVSIRLMGGKAECASACILAWIGAPMRQVSEAHPAFIIHRPFGFASAEQNLLAASGQWRTLQTDIHQHLLDMNIPATLLDAMNEIPSETSRKLSAEELSRYLMVVNDPAFAEIQDAKHAQALGVSRMEYLNRQRQFAECDAASNSNKNCMPERCGIATEEETMEYCVDYVTGPNAAATIEELRRHNRQLGWFITPHWEAIKVVWNAEK